MAPTKISPRSQQQPLKPKKLQQLLTTWAYFDKCSLEIDFGVEHYVNNVSDSVAAFYFYNLDKLCSALWGLLFITSPTSLLYCIPTVGKQGKVTLLGSTLERDSMIEIQRLHTGYSIIMHSQSPNDGILKNNCSIFPSRQSIFPIELLKLPWQSPLLANTRKYSSSRAGPIRVRIPPREYTDPYWAS